MGAEKKEHLDYNKLEAKDGVLTIIRREDAPLVINHDTAVSINGTITAPGNYIDERIEQLSSLIKKSHVLYNYRDLKIMLIVIENNPINAKVTGILQQNPDIAKMAINLNADGANKMESKKICDLLKFNKFLFADKEECMSIIQKLQTVKAKITTELETAHNMGDGKERSVYDRVISGVAPMGFDLLMPLFIGQKPKKFHVNINLDARDRAVVFYFESPELVELLKTEAEEIINKELKRFAGKGFVMIEQ